MELVSRMRNAVAGAVVALGVLAGTAAAQPSRPIVDVFANEVTGFSKYKLAKAYLRWTRNQTANALTKSEQVQWSKLIDSINKALK